MTDKFEKVDEELAEEAKKPTEGPNPLPETDNPLVDLDNADGADVYAEIINDQDPRLAEDELENIEMGKADIG